MEKSIEKIWNEAFVEEQALIAPKVNDLYNKKSKSLIHKIQRTYEIDNKGLIPMAILVAGGMAVFSEAIIGFYGAFLILCLYFFNRRLLKQFDMIDVKSDNLTYLKNYKKVMMSIIKATKKMFMYALPVAVLSIFVLAHSISEQSFLSKFITRDMNFLQIVGIGVVLGVLISIFCTLVYMISTKILYATLVSKLDAIIAELEELREDL